MRNPIIIYEHGDNLFLSQGYQDLLNHTPRSILWVHNGLYGLIPSEVIQNELRIRADRRRLAELCGTKTIHDTPLGFKWAETEDVPNGPKVVALLEEQSDDSGANSRGQNKG